MSPPALTLQRITANLRIVSSESFTMNPKRLVFLIIFVFNFTVDSLMASSHNTSSEFQCFPPQNFTLCHGLTLESNLPTSFSGSTMYTTPTPVHLSSNRTISFSIVDADTLFISPEIRNLGSPGGYLGLAETENDEPIDNLDIDSLNWMEATDFMDAGIDFDYNRSQKNLKPTVVLLDLSCYFQEEEETQMESYEYWNPQNVTDNTFDSGRIKQYELYTKLIGFFLIFFLLWYISGALEQNKEGDNGCEYWLDNEVRTRDEDFGSSKSKGGWIKHLDTFFEKYIKPREDFQAEDDDTPFPREAVLRVLSVVRKILENKHFHSSYEHHLSSLLASTDGDEVEACLQTLSGFSRKSKPSAFAQGWGGEDEGASDSDREWVIYKYGANMRDLMGIFLIFCITSHSKIILS